MNDVGLRQKDVWNGLAWALCLSAWTAALLTAYPVEVKEGVLPAPLQFPTAKLLHVTAYAALTAWAAFLPLGGRRWLLVALLSLHAFGTEYLQQFVPRRTASLHDVAIDHAGIVLGLVVGWVWLRPRG